MRFYQSPTDHFQNCWRLHQDLKLYENVKKRYFNNTAKISFPYFFNANGIIDILIGQTEPEIWNGVEISDRVDVKIFYAFSIIEKYNLNKIAS